MNIIEIRKQKKDLNELLATNVAELVRKAESNEITREVKANHIIYKIRGVEFHQVNNSSDYDRHVNYSIFINGTEFFFYNSEKLFDELHEAYQNLKEIKELQETIIFIGKVI